MIAVSMPAMLLVLPQELRQLLEIERDSCSHRYAASLGAGDTPVGAGLPAIEGKALAQAYSIA